LETNAEPARTRPAVQNALALTRANLEEARRSVLDLRAQPLEGKTLAEALTTLAAEAEWADRWHASVHLTLSGVLPHLPGRVEVGLYRIAQEALTNAARHAQAGHIQIQLRAEPAQVKLSITDDGIGFDPAHLPPGRYGLIGLNERAKLLDGILTLESGPGQGTRVEVSVPL
jgi:two-component system NarL family sensor kinase